jgi:hypothetical protein
MCRQQTATQNCGHSTLMVLNSDWSSLFSSPLSFETGLFLFQIQIITFTQILLFSLGMQFWDTCMSNKDYNTKYIKIVKENKEKLGRNKKDKKI